MYLYWCEYAEGGACWVFRYGNKDMDFGRGKTKWAAIRNGIKNIVLEFWRF